MLLKFLILSLFFSFCGASEGVTGLNGFVKESSNLQKYKKNGEGGLDLSKAKVAMYNQAGIRKYEAECAPNGYYFIPVYETGSFIVKVKGPGGWIVSPSKSTVECGEDGCAQGKDVNFEVVGFNVRGRVEGADIDGCKDAPSNFASVTVVLQSKGSSSPPVTVRASADGQFVFGKIVPGEYLLTAVHPTWSLRGPSNEEEIAVTVGWEGLQVKDSFIVQGYQVSGRVMSKNNPAVNVQVILYASTADIEVDCKMPSSEFQADKELGHPICEALTTENGEFTFSSIPCGQYHIVPRYSTPSTEFELSPSSVPIAVGHGNTHLGAAFQVIGFSMSGRVVHATSGKGVGGVHLEVNGKDGGLTDSDGYYKLSKLEEGAYSIKASKEDMQFASLDNIEVTSQHVKFPDITSTHYKLCGAISLTSRNAKAEQKVSIKSSASQGIETVISDAKGEFCFWTKPGKYTVSPEVSSEDKSKGLILGPRTREVEITDASVDGIIFTEKRLSLVVPVTRLDEGIEWGDLVVELQGADIPTSKATMNSASTSSFTVVNKGRVEAKFDGLIPTTYTVKVKRSGWCWESELLTHTIENADSKSKPFVQKGYVAQVYLSHSAHLQFSGPGAFESLSHQYDGGTQHSICVGSAGTHSVVPSGCFEFEEDKYEFDPAEEMHVDIAATHFNTRGLISIDEPEELASPIWLTLTSKKSSKTARVQASRENTDSISYSIRGAIGDTIEIKAEHGSILFSPKSIKVVNSGTYCQPDASTISGKPGLFLRARVEPSIDDVEVTLSNVDGKSLAKKMTGKGGKVDFGPLELTADEYSLSLKKIGYEFEEINSPDGKIVVFAAKKLVKVEVMVELEGQDKEGILVILTGGERYRSNAQTDSQGMVSFWDLPPATYYLKPVLKEYEFTPSIAEVAVEDGKDELVTFKAHRTAYSVSGYIQSFTQKAIGGVTIEAVGPDDLYETTTSNEDGSYRIRGLMPKMKYEVKVAAVDGVERGWPSKHEVLVDHESVGQKDFTVFMLPQLRRVTGAIKMNPDLVNQTSIEIVKVPKGNEKAIVVDTTKLDASHLFDFGVSEGHYAIRATSKTLAATHKCNFDLATATVGKNGPSQVHVGEIEMICVEIDRVGGTESGNRWPVVVAILVVAGMQWRQSIQEFFSSS